MLGIIGAMAEEVKRIKEIMTITGTRNIGGVTFEEGRISKTSVVLVQCGVGKVAAGVVTALLIENYKVDQVINVGTCGGILKDNKPLDLIVADQQAYGDVDLRDFDYPYGQMSGCPLFFKSDAKMQVKMVELIHKLKYSYTIGTILSSDAFISKRDQLMDLLGKHFSAAKIVGCDMESAAIAQVCTQFKTPYLIVRMISDIVGQAQQVLSFNEIVSKSSDVMAVLLQAYCQ